VLRKPRLDSLRPVVFLFSPPHDCPDERELSRLVQVMHVHHAPHELLAYQATRGLEVLGGLRAAPAARHPLYDLDVLAVFVLILEAQVHPAS
jgi:hypothetical protein